MSSTSRTRVPRLPLCSALGWSVGLSVLLTVFLITVISVRMAAGSDPALGPKIVRHSNQTAKERAAQSTPQPAQIVVVPDVGSAPVQQTQTQAPVAPTPVVPVAPVQTTTS